MAAKRNGRRWSDLSPAYRARLQRAGIDREAWLAGTDLRSTRGHAPGPPPDAAPPEPTERLVRGDATAADIREVERWHARHPDGLSTDTSAALSQISYPIDRWESVTFVPRPDGEPWTMTVTPKGGGYPETVEIPGGGAADTYGAAEVLELLAEEDIDHDVEGSG